MGYATEAFVFAYLGLTFFTYTDLKWSPSLFLTELGVVFVGRFCGTVGLVAFSRALGYRSDLTWGELIFIWQAGMIRGAIAFGLVLRIDDSYDNRGVIVTTSLSLVVFTTVVIGSTVGLLQVWLFGKTPEADREAAKLKKAEAQEDFQKVKPGEGNESFESVDLSDDESSYHRMMHPNEERTRARRIHTGCSKYLHRFDELIMKPIFIYKYEKNM